jgi:hypothetical protein
MKHLHQLLLSTLFLVVVPVSAIASEEQSAQEDSMYGFPVLKSVTPIPATSSPGCAPPGNPLGPVSSPLKGLFEAQSVMTGQLEENQENE